MQIVMDWKTLSKTWTAKATATLGILLAVQQATTQIDTIALELPWLADFVSSTVYKSIVGINVVLIPILRNLTQKKLEGLIH